MCQTQPISKDQTGCLLTLVCELALVNRSSRPITFFSGPSLITNHTTSANPLKLSNASCSYSKTNASCSYSNTNASCSYSKANVPLDSNCPVLDRPESTGGMLRYPATRLGSIGILPPEIQEMVFKNLSWDGAIHLAATNKHYRSAIIPDNHGDHTERAKFLRSQEDKPKYASYKAGKSWLACTGCWCLKPEKRFNIKQVTGLRFRKGGKAWRARRCLTCEIKMGRYEIPSCIANGAEKRMMLCKSCQEFRGGVHCEQCHLCPSCMGDPMGIKCSKCHGLPWFSPEYSQRSIGSLINLATSDERIPRSSWNKVGGGLGWSAPRE